MKVRQGATATPTMEWSPSQCMQSTPRTQTSSLLKGLRVKPSSVSRKARKQLVYLHSVDNSVRQAADSDSKAKATMIGLLSANTKLARQQDAFSSRIGAHHRRIAAVTEPTVELPRKRREPERRATVVRMVVDYLSRDEQSRMNPGRRYCITIDGEQVQTCVCMDYMVTLYTRFKAEYPLEKVGCSTFFSSRPAYILKSSSLQVFGCLCQTHENTSLLLKALKPLVTSQVSVSPDTFCDRFPESVSVSGMVAEVDKEVFAEVSFRQWQRVLHEGRKMWTKIVVSKLPADDFLQKVTCVVEDFRNHAGRVNTQYIKQKKLKDSLPTTSLLLQMDFAENFACLQWYTECPV